MINEEDIVQESVENRAAKLEEAFLNNLKKTGNKITVKGKKQELTALPEIKDNFDVEKLLLSLYEVRDGILDSFSKVDYNSRIAKDLSKHINVLGLCINDLGGQVEAFEPLNHISGLTIPNMVKSAERVIETTKQCYSLGSVESPKIENNGKTIILTFAGKSNDTYYKAIGTITANNSWLGNEAIDYIYCPKSGRMAVKALNENGTWIDRSSNYNVYWELEESIEEPVKENKGILKAENEITKQKKVEDISIEEFPIKEIK